MTTEWVALERGRGGPGPKKSAAQLCEEWNIVLQRADLGLRIRPGRGATLAGARGGDHSRKAHRIRNGHTIVFYQIPLGLCRVSAFLPSAPIVIANACGFRFAC